MKRKIYIVIGTISLILGIIGIVLPILPTTPFLLLTISMYAKSSDKLYNKIVKNKYLGPYVKDYLSGYGIPLHAKIKALALLWLSIGLTIFILDSTIIRSILLIIATSVSIYIWTRNEPNFNKK